MRLSLMSLLLGNSKSYTVFGSKTHLARDGVCRLQNSEKEFHSFERGLFSQCTGSLTSRYNEPKLKTQSRKLTLWRTSWYLELFYLSLKVKKTIPQLGKYLVIQLFKVFILYTRHNVHI